MTKGSESALDELSLLQWAYLVYYVLRSRYLRFKGPTPNVVIKSFRFRVRELFEKSTTREKHKNTHQRSRLWWFCTFQKYITRWAWTITTPNRLNVRDSHPQRVQGKCIYPPSSSLFQSTYSSVREIWMPTDQRIWMTLSHRRWARPWRYPASWKASLQE